MRHDLFATDVVAQLNIESSSQLTTLAQMRCAICIDEIEEILRIPKNSIISEFFYRLNAAVERRRAALSSDDGSPSAPTAC